jgi:hypothetical protein
MLGIHDIVVHQELPVMHILQATEYAGQKAHGLFAVPGPRRPVLRNATALLQTSSAAHAIQLAGKQSLDSAPAFDSLIATQVCLYLAVDDGRVRGWRGIAE